MPSQVIAPLELSQSAKADCLSQVLSPLERAPLWGWPASWTNFPVRSESANSGKGKMGEGEGYQRRGGGGRGEGVDEGRGCGEEAWRGGWVGGKRS